MLNLALDVVCLLGSPIRAEYVHVRMCVCYTVCPLLRGCLLDVGARAGPEPERRSRSRGSGL